MNPGARAQAAIDILDHVLTHHAPALAAVRDWGRTHRFAGSGDRAAIGTIVLDALRHRASLAWRMEEETPRALVLGWMAFVRGMTAEEIASLCALPHAPAPLNDEEKRRLARPRPLDDAPDWVRGDYPEWLHESLTRAFARNAAAEGAALASRAPLDIRVNTLKTDRARLRRSLAHLRAESTPFSPWGLRFREADGHRLPNVGAEPAFHRGHFEVQDEGSQIAAALCGARPGQLVLDLCAGGGGKTLALAAMMRNKGQVFAHDADRARLSAIVPRLRRAGAHNVQLVPPQARARLDALRERMHVVLVDAPCTGTGTWRRRPDAKWRLRPAALERHARTQRQLLREGAAFVRPGGLLVYATCSILPEENDEQAREFLTHHAGFTLLNWRDQAEILSHAPRAESGETLQLTPRQHGTDGFFIALFRRRAD